MIDLKLNSKIHFPKEPLFIPYDANFIAFSNTNFTCVLVDQKGKNLLERCSGELTFLEICQIQSQLSRNPLEKSLVQVDSFIRQLIDLKFVYLNEPSESISWVDLLKRENKASKVCYIDMTNHCNLNCVYCYNSNERQRNLTRGAKELTDNEILELLEELKANSFEYLVFTGGEPLLRKNVFKFAQLARNLGIQTVLLTNGTLITQDMAKEIADKFNFIIVSLDSCIKEEHELLRGKGTFSKIIKALEYMAATDQVVISIRPIITRTNIDNLYKLPRFAYDRFGCSYFEPTFYLPNSLIEMTTLKLLPDPEAYRSGMNRFYLELRKFSGTTEKNYESLTLSGKCGAGKSIFSISATGNVYPCQALHYDRFFLGNVRMHKFKDILSKNNPNRIKIPTVFDVDVCQSCNLALICGGGCRASAYNLYSNLVAHNKALCAYFQIDAQNTLVKEYLHQTKHQR